MNIDEVTRKECSKNPKAVVGFILAASYLYYCRSDCQPILSDDVFDKMCKFLYNKWDKLDHKYKYLINKEDLQAGSLFAIKEWEYPLGLRSVAIQLSQGQIKL